MEDITPEELNSLIAHFFIKVRKLIGDEFEPGTFDRFLQQHGKNYSIIRDKVFKKSREALESKGCQVKVVVQTRCWV